MRLPRRIGAETGRYSLVDGIQFELPVASHHSPALMAAFTIDAAKAAELLPGRELHPLLLWDNRGLLMITVVDYTSTNIGKYIEFSIAIFVTHGLRPAPALLPLLFQKRYDIEMWSLVQRGLRIVIRIASCPSRSYWLETARGSIRKSRLA